MSTTWCAMYLLVAKFDQRRQWQPNSVNQETKLAGWATYSGGRRLQTARLHEFREPCLGGKSRAGLMKMSWFVFLLTTKMWLGRRIERGVKKAKGPAVSLAQPRIADSQGWVSS